MPFEECAGLAFTNVSVQKNAPGQSGVYGLSNAREWIFVGEANDIRAALLAHLKEAGTLLKTRNPTGFTFEISSPSDRISRQNELVREFEPFCNRRSR